MQYDNNYAVVGMDIRLNAKPGYPNNTKSHLTAVEQ